MTDAALGDRRRSGRLPQPLARAAVAVHDAVPRDRARALARFVDVLLGFVARLWIAEFLEAGAPDGAVARRLVGALSLRPLLGAWVGLAASAQAALRRRSAPLVLPSLDAVTLSERAESRSPVARLLAFRRAVAHGGLAEAKRRDEEAEDAVRAVLDAWADLYDHPICFRDAGDRAFLAARLDCERVSCAGAPGAPPLAPFIVRAGRALRLDPLFHVSERPGGWELRLTGVRDRTLPLSRILDREPLRAWVARMAEESAGQIDFEEALSARRACLPAAPTAWVRDGLSEPGVLLVEAHPGTGGAALVAAAAGRDPFVTGQGRFDDVIAWVVEPEGPGRRGAALARRVVASIGARLGTSFGTPPDVDALPTLRAALTAAKGRSLRILLAVAGAEHGRGDAESGLPGIADVLQELAGGPLSVLVVSHPLGVAARLSSFDRRIPWPVPAEADLDRDGIRQAVRGLCGADPLRARSLRRLARGPATLFALCDALETETGEAVFDPAVERALHDLRPLLTADVDSNGEQRWALFSPVVARVLEEAERAS